MFKTKKYKVLVAMAVVAMVVIAATPSTLKRQVWNALQFFRHGIYVGSSNQTKIFSDGSASLAGGNLVYNTSGQMTTEAGETPTDYVNLPIGAHTATNALIGNTLSAYYAAQSINDHGYLEGPHLFPHGDTASAPTIDLQNGVPTLIWNVEPNNEDLRKAIVTFRVPANYSSIPVLTLFASGDNTTTSSTSSLDVPRVGYELLFNSTGVAEDTVASINFNNPVALSGNASTPSEVALTIHTTDSAVIAAGQWLTVRYWRSKGNDSRIRGADNSTVLLRSRGLVFSYVKEH